MQAGGGGFCGLCGDFVRRELIDPGHALDRAAGGDFFVNEKREDEIVRAETGLAHEVAEGGGASEPARTMDQFPHRARLRARVSGSKLSRWPVLFADWRSGFLTD